MNTTNEILQAIASKRKALRLTYYALQQKCGLNRSSIKRIEAGEVNASNLHPFLVNKDLGFVHNGVISGLGDAKFSDTYYFNQLLQQLPTNFLKNKSIVDLIAARIGRDKLVFLDKNSTWTIINPANGHFFEGDWYSNSSYVEVNNYEWFGNTKLYKKNKLRENVRTQS
jgi:transcriptional regulator with XRE-family HTH domain